MPEGSRFVLVHGSFHGGWCWDRVADRLRRVGAEVHAPTLTGLAERAPELSLAVGLDTHVGDVVGLLEHEDLENVVLVGHSYGGMVITGAADAVPGRIAVLVYLDATIPEHGRSQYELRRRPAPTRVVDVGGVPCLPVPDSPFPFGVSDPDDRAWLTKRLTPHPLRTKLDPLVLRRGRLPPVPGVYVRCTIGWDGQPRGPEPPDRWRPAVARHLAYRELHAVHDAMVTAPDAVAALLGELAGKAARGRRQ